ncbi:MAG TPA: bacillithiol biosynthesis cysteine-adding enzyme BshC [Acidobacteriaceae bacterium]|nr:bacillithiol biosynthesis cysteine-adding enzyme BshC [Acidobacteriaceae bacterium]
MTTECYPISNLPRLSRLFLDFAERREPLSPFYPATAYSTDWVTAPVALGDDQRAELCRLLEVQNREAQGGELSASSPLLQNIHKLRSGAGAVVTGQQVTLFGGPLFTLLKAATAIRKAKDASSSGYPHVPVFWLATEDHDLAEAAEVTLLAGEELRTLRLTVDPPAGSPVGPVLLGQGIEELVQQAVEIVGSGPLAEELARCYRPDATFSQAFAGFLSRIFAGQGLIVVDASTREFHALGSGVLREAIVRADELQVALADRDQQLKARGYHSQVLVSPNSSLLFLIDSDSGARMPLRRVSSAWQAGRQSYSSAELLDILDEHPERVSPNALLRPVFQDCILPTGAYVGGPAEVAYFAQSEVLYERILGRTTPILPRLSATLIEPAMAELLAKYGTTLPEIIHAASHDPLELAQRLGARAMPVEAKRKLASAGNSLDEELHALTEYLNSLNADLGRAANVAASKMRYQMNRLRRLAANYQLKREEILARHAGEMMLHLFPDRHPQERVLGAAGFLARYGESLPELLVEQAGQQCPGHKAIWL